MIDEEIPDIIIQQKVLEKQHLQLQLKLQMVKTVKQYNNFALIQHTKM